jgi:hypothetical protein
MTPRFTCDALDARQVGPDRWKLLRSLVFIDEDGAKHQVPRWFVTDFASVPWMMRRLFPKSGRWNRAAALHDYQCLQKREDSATIHARFRRALRACGCGKATETVMWSMVRTFGPRFEAQSEPEAAA